MITSDPFVERRGEQGARAFETLDAKQIGIDFFHAKNPSLDLSPEITIGSGVALGDYDADGRVDVFLARSTDGGRLYRNLGDWRFRDVTDEAGMTSAPGRWTTGASFVDVDNDGDLDLFVCGYDCPNHLYLNEGRGKFVERGAEFGLAHTAASVMMAFADFDRDGDLDAYLVTNHTPPDREISYNIQFDEFGVPRVPRQYLEYRETIRRPDGTYSIIETGQYDYLYRNNGDGTFSDVTEGAGIRGPAARIRGNDRGLAATWWDYNGDLWPDLYVANDFWGGDRLYRNNRDGTFTDVIAELVPHTPWFSMGCDAADINNDGHFDLMATDMSESTDYRDKMTRRNPQTSGWFLELPIPRQVMRNALYLNTGARRFQEIACLSGLDSTNWTWSVRFVDLDQDGFQDVHITNGMSLDLDNNDLKDQAQRAGPMDSQAYRRFWAAQRPLRQRNFAFRNLGNLRFEDMSRRWGLDQLGVSFGAAFGDLDGDGDLDLVINNLEDMVTVARNVGAAGHAARIRLRGTTSNRWGIGATVRARVGDVFQTRYLTLAQGFMSASDPTVHFGLGEAIAIDELTIDWPSGQSQSFTDLAADRLYTVTEPSGTVVKGDGTEEELAETLFAPSTALQAARHSEQPFDDLSRQPLLPIRLSQLGPGLAVGDVNGDALEDLFLGAAKGDWGDLLLNQGGGKWAATAELFPPWSEHADCEDMGVLLFDADGDGDLDLYAVSGGVECEPGDESLRDRLYLNDGSGSFAYAASGEIPDLRDSGSVVAAADCDRDGDLDLFVGGRSVPGRYPETPFSRLLSNAGGHFRDATADDAPELLQSGLVTSAVWSDANGDGWIDLLVTHDWGPIKLFINEGGRLRDATQGAGLSGRLGWWNGIAGRDLDGDGDVDYVATNLGRNTVYRVTADRPARLFYGDFSGDGQRNVLEGKYDELGRLVPTRTRPGFEQALPLVAAAFPTFHDYASATLAEIVGEQALEDSLQLTANTLDSMVLWNDGRGSFRVEPLPIEAQVAPGFGVMLTDFDADGRSDVYIVQNLFSPRREIGRMDGGVSVLLLGCPDGHFSAAPATDSGLVVPGDAKSVVATDVNGDQWPDLVVGVNNSDVMAFEDQHVSARRLASVRLRGRPGNPTGVGARVTLHRSDGVDQTAEVQAGGGYLSQQSATLYFGLARDNQIDYVDVRWPDGHLTRVVPPPEAADNLLIQQPERTVR